MRNQEAERKRKEWTEWLSREQAKRWKEEREDQLKREVLKAMAPDQDLADYLDMFKDNMKSRDSKIGPSQAPTASPQHQDHHSRLGTAW